MKRRLLMKSVISSGILLAVPGVDSLASTVAAPGWPEAAFSAATLSDAIARLLGTATVEESNLIDIELSRISENGANVPIGVNAAAIENVESISLFSEKNPVPLLASFAMTDGVAKRLTTRIRLAGTTRVVVVVKARNRLYGAGKTIKVTVGGCGG